MLTSIFADRYAARQFGGLAAFTLGLGALLGAAVGSPPLRGAVEGMVYGGVIGIPLALLESYASYVPVPAGALRLSFGLKLGLRSLSYAAWIMLGGAIAGHLTHAHEAEGLRDLLSHRDKLVAALLAAITVNVVLGANRLLGPGVFLRFLGGRYRHPRHEERTFLMLDLCGSTGIAERIGDLRFHRYVDDVWRLAERAALRSNAEVHDYVGDQIILTWPNGRKAADGPWRFMRHFMDSLTLAAPRLEAVHGAEIRFRTAIHSGSVVAGEIGWLRRKIAFMGDTINTTARLEQLARDRDEPILVTRQVLGRWPLPPTMTAKPLGAVPLRGRSQPIEVFGVENTGGSSVRNGASSPVALGSTGGAMTLNRKERNQ